MTTQSTQAKQRPATKNIVVAGYGPVGRVVTEALEACGTPVTIIELNENTCDKQQTLGKRIVYGDAADPSVLQRAGVDKADTLILTIPDEQASLRACKAAREMTPNLFIVARTNHPSAAMQATNAGANQVIVEELVTAQAMQQAVMSHLHGDRTND